MTPDERHMQERKIILMKIALVLGFLTFICVLIPLASLADDVRAIREQNQLCSKVINQTK